MVVTESTFLLVFQMITKSKLVFSVTFCERGHVMQKMNTGINLAETLISLRQEMGSYLRITCQKCFVIRFPYGLLAGP